MSEIANDLVEKIFKITKEEIQRQIAPFENTIIDFWLEKNGPYCPTLTEDERQQIIRHVVHGDCLILRCTFVHDVSHVFVIQ